MTERPRTLRHRIQQRLRWPFFVLVFILAAGGIFYLWLYRVYIPDRIIERFPSWVQLQNVRAKAPGLIFIDQISLIPPGCPVLKITASGYRGFTSRWNQIPENNEMDTLSASLPPLPVSDCSLMGAPSKKTKKILFAGTRQKSLSIESLQWNLGEIRWQGKASLKQDKDGLHGHVIGKGNVFQETTVEIDLKTSDEFQLRWHDAVEDLPAFFRLTRKNSPVRKGSVRFDARLVRETQKVTLRASISLIDILLPRSGSILGLSPQKVLNSLRDSKGVVRLFILVTGKPDDSLERWTGRIQAAIKQDILRRARIKMAKGLLPPWLIIP